MGDIEGETEHVGGCKSASLSNLKQAPSLSDCLLTIIKLNGEGRDRCIYGITSYLEQRTKALNDVTLPPLCALLSLCVSAAAS